MDKKDLTSKLTSIIKNEKEIIPYCLLKNKNCFDSYKDKCDYYIEITK